MPPSSRPRHRASDSLGLDRRPSRPTAQYSQTTLAEVGLFDPLLTGTDDGYADIQEFLARLKSGLTTAQAPGCLIVNDMAAGADPEAAQRYRSMLEDGILRALTRAGETDELRRAHRAGLLATSVIGVNLVSKTTGDPEEIGRLVDAMTDLVRSWQHS